MFRKTVKIFSIAVVLMFAGLIILKPFVCSKGALSGLLICGRVIIPSLFPFTICVIFIMRSGLLSRLCFLDKVTTKILGLDSYETGLVIMSLIGGYPVGAKLLNNAVKMGEITSNRAGQMLEFCVNAGPAFIVSAVGSTLLHSAKLGYILLICHILSGFVLILIFKVKGEKRKKVSQKPERVSVMDNFVLSVSEAAGSVMGICSFVILFSVINEYMNSLAKYFKGLKNISILLEVANGVTLTNNLYIICFLLGFSGVCVWCQILSVSNSVKINYIKFVLSRFIHGILSVAFLWIIFKIFKISVAVSFFEVKYNYSTPILSLSMLLMCIVFMISVVGKKYSGKILEDMV